MSEQKAGREKLVVYFEARVIRRGADECWGWKAHIDKNGYTWASVGHALYHGPAHRLAYELFVGSIPQGLHIDHLCRNPGCVNPAHLEPVTLAENVMRGEGITARYARSAVCKQGHPRSGENLYIRPGDGARCCRMCRRAQDKKDKERRRQRDRAA